MAPQEMMIPGAAPNVYPYPPSGNVMGSPQYAAPVIIAPPVAPPMAYSIPPMLPGEILAGHQKVILFQKSQMIEAITGGLWEKKNEYVVLDESGKFPLIVIKENSTSCCRQCCAPHHPLSLEFYPAVPEQVVEKSKASAHGDMANLTGIKAGCCEKTTDCFACYPCCVDELQLYPGHVLMQGDESRSICGFTKVPGCGCCSDSEDPTYCYYKYPDNAPPPIASVYEPIGGGGLKPQLNVIARGIQSSDYSNTPGDIMAKVVGPCIFGGCSEYCFDTSFQVKNPRYPDASIKKQAPTNFSEAGRTAFTDSDTYQINFGQNMTPYEKATLLTTALLVDYKFFEFDRESCCPLPKGCDIASTEKGFEIVITCF
eukprot:gene25702-31433_t